MLVFSLYWIEIVRGLFIGRGGVGEGLLERYGKPKD